MGAPAAPATVSVRARSVGLYRPRRPRASPLYRLLEDHFAEFSTVYDERFAHCPSCHAKRLALWGLWLEEALLADVPHRQVVLAVPKRLRPYLLYNRALLGDLSRVAARTITAFIRTTVGEAGLSVGIIASIQTDGSLALAPAPPSAGDRWRVPGGRHLRAVAAARCHNTHRGLSTGGAASVRASGTHGCRDGPRHARLAALGVSRA